MKAIRRTARLVTLVFLAVLAGCGSLAQPPGPRSITIGLMGDMPYRAVEVHAVDALVDDMNREDLEFVLHTGDLTSGRGPCSNEWFQARRAQLDRLRHPIVVVPGDNDWVDCHRSGPWQPLERLDYFRRLFASGDESLGQRRIRLERQGAPYAQYREHARWIAADVLFVALNVQGTNNNLGRTAAMDREHEDRMKAALAWMDDSFGLAARRGLAGILLFMQADPDFELKFKRAPGVPDGFRAFRDALRAHAVKLGRPVLLVHGDEHLYINDRPMKDSMGRRIDNFTRIQVYGSPLIRWLRARVDPASPRVFEVEPAPAPKPAD